MCIVFSVKFRTKIAFEARLGDVSTSSKRRCESGNSVFFRRKFGAFSKLAGTQRVNKVY